MSALVHVADNPAKDFLGLYPLVAATSRVLTGQHAKARARARARAGAETTHRIPDLDALLGLLSDICVRVSAA